MMKWRLPRRMRAFSKHSAAPAAQGNGKCQYYNCCPDWSVRQRTCTGYTPPLRRT